MTEHGMEFLGVTDTESDLKRPLVVSGRKSKCHDRTRQSSANERGTWPDIWKMSRHSDGAPRCPKEPRHRGDPNENRQMMTRSDMATGATATAGSGLGRRRRRRSEASSIMTSWR